MAKSSTTATITPAATTAAVAVSRSRASDRDAGTLTVYDVNPANVQSGEFSGRTVCVPRRDRPRFPDSRSDGRSPTPGKVARVDLFEYQGKQLFARYGIPVSPGAPVDTVPEAVEVADGIGYPVVVKAQVQVGGRGKAGGIKLANNADEVREHANAILGMDIKGHTVEVVWIEKASDIEEEYYASFTLDRAAKLHLGMLSAQGGVEIEQVAEENPDAIARIHIDPVDGLSEDVCRAWVEAAQLNPKATDGAVEILLALVPLLHRRRRRPHRDQPADPHARRSRARARRQGHARRQRGVPSPRLRRVRRDASARRARAVRAPARAAVRRPRRVRRRDRERRGARDEHRRHREPGRWISRRTSSTSAAAPTPT